MFKPFLECRSTLKAYHNYSFDRHVLYNHGIDTHGLGGDTMHMARLWSASRAKRGGYSLESLTADLLDHRKVPMKERFALHKLKKDGTPGKETYLPPVEDIQESEEFREVPAQAGRQWCRGGSASCPFPFPLVPQAWIDYSTYDTEGTWKLRELLQGYLEAQPWSQDKSMYDWYRTYMVPYAEVLTDMERAGIQVDVNELLPRVQAQAEHDKRQSSAAFIDWAVRYCPDAERMNIGSGTQKAHLLFAPCARQLPKRKTKKGVKIVLGEPGTYAADATHWPEVCRPGGGGGATAVHFVVVWGSASTPSSLSSPSAPGVSCRKRGGLH